MGSVLASIGPIHSMLFLKTIKTIHSHWQQTTESVYPNNNTPVSQQTRHRKKVFLFPLPHWSPIASIELVKGCSFQPILSEIGMIRFYHWMIVENLPEGPRQTPEAEQWFWSRLCVSSLTYWLIENGLCMPCSVRLIFLVSWSLPALFLHADVLGFSYQPTVRTWAPLGHRRRG